MRRLGIQTLRWGASCEGYKRRMVVAGNCVSPMPVSSPTACSQPRCPYMAVVRGRCGAHAAQKQRDYDRQRGNPAARGYNYHWIRVTRPAVLAEEPYCADPFNIGCIERSVHVDHVIPKAQDGTDVRSNLQGTCAGCHARKTLIEQLVTFVRICKCETVMRAGFGSPATIYIACEADATADMLHNVRRWPQMAVQRRLPTR
jgi:5-methylcytosine-specific restriction protein A